ncbi:DUF3054 domain-containing protein [Arthrobacter sp. CAL618]|uniref:DUF3054 domain-containing protein n=1 Tax=Arthrobacter sp. CAL618 TaxID=1055770 RepID=UPI000465B71A|nr:DUF3054 domain-containing protein [Arthrobacter sp. CAL618]
MNVPRLSKNAPAEGRTRPTGRAVAGWLAADLVLITGFAATGRSTHESGLAILGVLGTAAPFITACLLTWGASRAWRSPSALWPTGMLIWLGTAVGGLGIRALLGGGMAISFQLVAVLVLGAVLLLPRAIAAMVLRWRSTSR